MGVLKPEDYWEGRFDHFGLWGGSVRFKTGPKKRLHLFEVEQTTIRVSQRDELGEFEWERVVHIEHLWPQVVDGFRACFPEHSSPATWPIFAEGFTSRYSELRIDDWEGKWNEVTVGSRFCFASGEWSGSGRTITTPRISIPELSWRS